MLNATQTANLAETNEENAATREASENAADAAYATAQRSAWNAYFLDYLNKTGSYNDLMNAALDDYQDAMDTAADAYDDTILPGYDTFIDAEDEITDVYVYNIDFITNDGTISNDVFTNPTFDYEVCFVAGTQVLMADGSTKSIETIEPGDQVLAAHHLNPEEKPTSAKVLTFFDNGLKSVVKLIFENPKTGETQEIVCTPEHPFYVIDKGWIRSQDLQQGNLCLSATGEKIAFLSRESLPERRRVYNFEVEEKHTYFVGVNIEI